jgi:hypothetical protein
MAEAGPKRRRATRAGTRALAPLFVVALAVGATAPTSAKADTLLTIEYVETHDRLDPDPRAGIVVRHEIEATLTADNHVAEREQRQTGGRKQVFFNQLESRGALGDNSAWATWRVLGPHKLERLFAGRGFLLKIDVDIGADNACSVDVAYLLQAGATAMVTRRLDTGDPARISHPKLLSAQCSIR